MRSILENRILSFGNKDYSRAITLICPTCAGDDLSDPSGTDDDERIIVCNSCGIKNSYETVYASNKSRIESGISDLKEEVVKDITKEFKNMFK